LKNIIPVKSLLIVRNFLILKMKGKWFFVTEDHLSIGVGDHPYFF